MSKKLLEMLEMNEGRLPPLATGLFRAG